MSASGSNFLNVELNIGGWDSGIEVHHLFGTCTRSTSFFLIIQVFLFVIAGQ